MFFLSLVKPLFCQGKLSINGLFVVPYWDADTRHSVQFDTAVNAFGTWSLSERTQAFVALQSGVGQGPLGLQGSGVVITDVGVCHRLYPDTQIQLGSFDLPFGQETDRLTNNGALGGAGFVINPLLYTALAGPSGTLNTVGVLLVRNIGQSEGKFFVSNGTGENAVNGDAQVAYGGTWIVPFADFRLGVSAWRSNDQGDAQHTAATSLKADVTAYVLDIHTEQDGCWYSGSFGQMWFGDGTSKASLVTVGILGAGIRYAEIDWRARVSWWLPQDNDGDGLGISTRVPDPSMSTAFGAGVSDRDVVRYQIGMSIPLESGVVAGMDAFLDHVRHGSQTSGVMSYLSVEVE